MTPTVRNANTRNVGDQTTNIIVHDFTWAEAKRDIPPTTASVNATRTCDEDGDKGRSDDEATLREMSELRTVDTRRNDVVSRQYTEDSGAATATKMLSTSLTLTQHFGSWNRRRRRLSPTPPQFSGFG